MLIHAYAPLSRLLLSAAAKGRILVENRMKIQGLQSQAGVAWECMVLHNQRVCGGGIAHQIRL
jgi:hypothetical protein